MGVPVYKRILDLFEAEQQLILRQRLGPSTEAMTLQLFDDLLQPFGACPLRQQHRFERAGIVRKRVRQDRHGAIRSCAAAPCELRERADSLCGNHPGRIGAGVSRAA